MAETVTHSLFEQHIDSAFRIELNDSAQNEPQPAGHQEIELTLTEVSLLKNHGAQPRAPFSLVFQGPKDILLQQGTYRLRRSGFEPAPLFIVPIGQNDSGYLYEVVFN